MNNKENKHNNMKTNYPWQIDSVIHKSKTVTKTLGMDAFLSSPKEEDELRTPSAPLEMHEGYSVFRGTLIIKAGDTKFLKFNIPPKSVPYIHKKTSIAIDSNLKASIKRKSKPIEEGSSPAYTVKFRAGTFNGKSPAQLLIESPKNREVLEKQKAFLEKNLEKYPSNKAQIDAINDAIQLFEAGRLNNILSEASKEMEPIEIYDSFTKNIKPLDAEGRYTIYQVKVTYNPAMSLPFAISVMNCFAPVDKTKGNEIIMKKAVNKQEQEIRLTEEEWYTMIDKMKAIKIMYENLTYPEQLKLAAKISKDNFEASKHKES